MDLMIGCGLYYHFIAEINSLFLCVEYNLRNYFALKIQLLNSAMGYFCPEKNCTYNIRIQEIIDVTILKFSIHV